LPIIWIINFGNKSHEYVFLYKYYRFPLYLYKKWLMQTLKKKDIKKYIGKIDNNAEVELDELVNSVGGSIGSDDKNLNTSQIKTAPQATTDDFNTKAIQPNRYLFNVDAVNAAGNAVSTESIDKLAKNKMLKLLENISTPDLSKTDTLTDFNKNDVSDINELPSNVARKVTDLIETVDNNNLSKNQVELILKIINQKLENNA